MPSECRANAERVQLGPIYLRYITHQQEAPFWEANQRIQIIINPGDEVLQLFRVVVEKPDSSSCSCPSPAFPSSSKIMELEFS